MLDESVRALIHKDLDGMASAEESARLREILAQNAEARAMAEDLQALARELASVERAVPPPTLRPAVLRSLASLPARGREGWWERLLQSLRHAAWDMKPSLVFAGGAAAGLILCLAGWWLMAPGGVDERDLAGSLAFRHADFPETTMQEFSEGPLHASIRSARRSGEAFVRVRLDVPSGTVISFLYDRNKASVLALEVPGGAKAEILPEEGRVIVRGAVSGDVGVLFSGKGEILPGIQVRLANGLGTEWVLPAETTPFRQ